MTEQIRTQPPVFEVAKNFGPFMAHIQLPEEVVVNLTKMTDNLLKNSNTPSHGQQLAGVNDMLEGCVRTYVYESIIRHGNPKDSSIETRINSAWIVSQYENEYNPVHGHTGCEISGVLYLKTPDVKDRRKIPSKEGKKDHDGDITFTYNSESQRSGELLSKGVMQITPSRGLMLLFPSWLLHQVYPFIGKDERRSIAFNANYKVGINPEGGRLAWLGGNETDLKLEYTYWDKTKIKGETK